MTIHAYTGTRGGPIRRGRVRTALLWLLTLVVLLAAVAALAPTLVSLGLGQGLVRGALQEQVNGEVSFASLKLRWLGDQAVNDLRIVDESGRTAVAVDVSANRGLLAILRGALAPMEIRVSGSLDGTIEDDGTISFARLLRSEPGKGGAPGGAKRPDEPASLPDQGPIDVILSGTTLHLAHAASGQAITMKDIDGRLTYAPGLSTSLEIKAATDADGLAGAIDLQAEALGLVDRAGALAWSGAGLQVNAVLSSIPVLGAETGSVIDTLHVNVTSDDLTRQVLLLLDGAVRVGDAAPSTLEGRIAVDRPFAADGTPTIALERVTGTLSGGQVPSGLLAPVLAAAGLGATVDPQRDVGPTLDVDAVATGGTPGAFSLTLTAERLEARLAGSVSADDGTIGLEPSRVTARVQPGLLAALAGLQADRETTVTLEIQRASVPGAAGEAARELGGVAAAGTLLVEGPVTLGFSEPGATDQDAVGTIDRVALGWSADPLSAGLRLDGSGRALGADLTIEALLKDLVDEAGSFTPARLRPVGRIAITGLPADVVDRRLVEAPRPGYLAAMGATTLDATLRTAERERDLVAELAVIVAAAAGDGRLDATARETAGGIAVDLATFAGVLAPGLVAMLQGDAEAPIALAKPAGVTATVAPFLVPGDRERGFGRPTTPVTATLGADELVLSGVPGLAQPVGASGLEATVVMRPGEPSGWDVDAQGTLASGQQGLGTVDARIAWPGAGGAPFTGTVRMADAAFGAWERVLGYEAGTLRDWLGGRGALEAVIEPLDAGYRATLRPETPTLGGTLVASMADDMLELRSEDATYILRRKVLADLLGGRAGGAGDGADDRADDAPADTGGVRVPTPLRLRIAIEQCRLPLAALRGEAFAADQARIDLALTGGPLELGYPDGTTAALRDIQLAVRSQDLRQGLGLRLDATSAAGGSGEAETGVVTVNGTLVDVLDDDGALALADGRLQLEAQLDAMPTAVVDAMAGFDGLLVAALGPRLDARITASDFSRSSGTLDATLDALHGSLRAKVAGRDGTLASREPAEAQLEMTPGLGRRLLARINPIFADVRTVEGPIRVTASDFVVPMDGEVGRLQADLGLTVGEVQLTTGSLLLGLIEVANRSTRETVTAFIEPVQARIRDGVVTYDRFVVRLDKYTLAYTGTIDLNTGRIALRTEIPLSGLAAGINELRDLPEALSVPLVTTGTFESYKTEADLQGVLSEQGVGSALEGLLKGLIDKKK